MNELEHFFFNENHRMIHKWRHYFEVYDRHFNHLKKSGKTINLLEIGISHGGSLQMWDYYFKGNVNIYAIDINPECKQFESGNVQVFIGSQEDKLFLQTLKNQIPPIDILIDDGGHTMKQQVNTFEIMFDHLQENGIYTCEDLHTSYWKFYGGGYKKKRSFIEYCKNLVDSLHAWHSKDIKINAFTETIHSVHFYDSMVVIEKRKMSAPFDVKRGNSSIEDKYADQLLSGNRDA
jgi:23S rRNA U2552 (ribose-2'-O)-methylase RlmE/FtsJ